MVDTPRMITTDEFLSDAEKISGIPVVVSPYGFKKQKVNGKTYLAPMTQEEARSLFQDALGDQFHESMVSGTCLTVVQDGAQVCQSAGCTGACYPVAVYGGIICQCR
jgi:hypothetical protein